MRSGACVFVFSLGFDLPWFVCCPRSIVAEDGTRGAEGRKYSHCSARKGTASAEAPTSFRPGRRGPGGESSRSSGSGDSRRFGICDMSAVAGGRMFSTRLTTAASAASERERAGGCALLARFTFLLNCIRSRGKAIRGEGEGRPGCFACVGVCVPGGTRRLVWSSVLMRASGEVRSSKTLRSRNLPVWRRLAPFHYFTPPADVKGNCCMACLAPRQPLQRTMNCITKLVTMLADYLFAWTISMVWPFYRWTV